MPGLVPKPLYLYWQAVVTDQLKNTIPRARTIGDVISGHAHT